MIFSILAFLFFVVGYEMVLNFIFKLKLNNHKINSIKMDNKNLPKISIIIPTRNEEKIIRRKIINTLSLDYPKNKFDIIVVDNSTDFTGKIASKFHIRTLSIKKRGKVPAINEALKKCSSEIVVITDADIILSKDVLKKSLNFLNGNIAAVCGRVSLANVKSLFQKSKENYVKKDWEIRYKEGIVDSCCSIDGKYVMFRKSVIDKIPSDAFVDDLEMTYILRKKGYRCLVNKDIVVKEITRDDFNFISEVKRMRRTIKLALLTSFRHFNLFFNLKYGYYGILIYPFRRFFNFFLPILLISIFYQSIFGNQSLYLFLFLIFSSLIFLRKSLPYYSILFVSTIASYFDIITGNFKRGGILKD